MSSCMSLDPEAFFSSLSGEAAAAAEALTHTSLGLTISSLSFCFYVSPLGLNFFLLLAAVCAVSEGQQIEVNHCSLLIGCFLKPYSHSAAQLSGVRR